MFKFAFLLLPISLLAAQAAEPAKEPETKHSSFVPDGYQLSWQDEFDGDQLDRKKWSLPSYKTRGSAQINSEGTIQLKDGLLHLTTLWRDEKVHASYVQTRGRYQPTYGYFESRLKFQKHQGHHGCFWLQTPNPEKIANDPARSGTEMDIVEWFGSGRRRGWAGMNIYYYSTKSDGSKDRIRSPSIPDFPKMGGPVESDPKSAMADLSDGFRTYGLLWTEKECVFYCNGVEIMRDTEAVSQVPQYIVLSLLCENWERPRLDTAKLPDGMQVDYVRVYVKP